MSTFQEVITANDLLLLKSPAGIDEVIMQLEKIIAYCKINNSRAGYFAVLYYKVTCKIRDCIANKDFQDCDRMERLDVAFATRYLEAFYSWMQGKQTRNSWKIAFEIVNKPALAIQDLLLGMNAHINLDLGIATASVMSGFIINDIHGDFNMINSILASMIDNIENCLTKVNPLMRLLNLNIYKYDEMLVQFSINAARNGAWDFATELAGKTGTNYEDCIHARDATIEQLGISIAYPRAFMLKLMVKLIRLFEQKNVAKVINLLGN